MISLRKIDAKNIKSVCNLIVKENQKTYIESNTDSLLEAFLALTSHFFAMPFAIYADEELIGFTMIEYGLMDDPLSPPVADNNYCIASFMIGSDFQGHGYGKQALLKTIEYIKTFPCGEANYCWLSYNKDNEVAKKLYFSIGFVEIDEHYAAESVAILKLN